MQAIDPKWRSINYYSFNEKHLAHKAFYLELRYVLRKKEQLNAQINALRFTTPNQPPQMKQDHQTAPMKISELKLDDISSAEPIYDTEDQHSDTESDMSTQIDCICNGAVDDNKYVICCDMCNKWHHRKCASLTVKQWQFLSKHGSLTWHCKTCQEMIKSETPSMLEKIDKFQSKSQFASFQNSKRTEVKCDTKSECPNEAKNLQRILESVEAERDSKFKHNIQK